MTTDGPQAAKRRGRPPIPAEDRKSTNLKFRTRAGVRERLEAEAEKKNRSVSEEVEWRIERSFDYESVDVAVNEAFIRYMRVFFGGSNNPIAMAVLAAFWQRAIDTANRRIRDGKDWFESEMKQKEMADVMQRAVKAAIKDAAYAEQHKAARSKENTSSHTSDT